MKHPFSSLLLLLFLVGFSFVAHSQSKKFNIRGIVKDSATHKALPLATVYVKNRKDSMLEAYALTENDGSFELKGLPDNKTLSFQIFYTGYKRYYKLLKNIKVAHLNLGTIYLTQTASQLGEVTILGEKPPIVIKKDTIEFNASSFHTRPNSPLARLLKKLPGVNVDKDGNITAQGKTVDQIKVNGKDFFGKDPKIALQNLPAAIIDKVQVTDTKTEQEEITGKPASGDTKTINVTLKKGKDHGFFGRAYAGKGTDKHFDLSALLNYFNGDRQISLLGATNNINEIGFSTGEISNMLQGHGSGGITTYGNNAAFNIGGIRLGGGQEGIRRTTTTGINYNDEYGKHFSANGSYFYGNIQGNNHTQTSKQNILPDSIFYYNAETRSHNNNLNHRIHANLSFKDSSWIIYYKPSLSFSHTEGQETSAATSKGEKGALINKSNSAYLSQSQDRDIKHQLTVGRRFKKKGQILVLNLFGNSRHSKGEDKNRFRNLYYTGDVPGDSADQSIQRNVSTDGYFSTLSYYHPLSEDFRLHLGYQLQWQHAKNNKATFDYNEETGKYNLPDSTLSNNFRSNGITQTPTLGFSLKLDSGKWTINADADFNVIHMDDYSYTHKIGYKKQESFLSPSLRILYRLENKGVLRLVYSSYIRQPTISQLLPVADNKNPLYITKGNPDLRPSVHKRIRVGYHKYDPQSGVSENMRVGFSQIKNDIVSVTSYDPQHRQTTTYKNVKGNKEINLYTGFHKSRKKKNSYWRAGIGIVGRYKFYHAYVNTRAYSSNGIFLNATPTTTWGINDLLELNASYQFRYRYNKYHITALHDRENIMQKMDFSWDFYLPRRFTWTSDIQYIHNSNVSPGFQKGYWLWNATIGYDLFKERQATIQLSVYDLLDQNISIHRSITDTYIQDTQTQILQRYFMIKLIYHLKKFGDKKQE